MKDKGSTYRDAGVDIDAGDALVERIKPLARRTARPEVLTGIGGFGGLFEVPQGYRHPVLVVGTDGRPSNIRVLSSLGMGLDEKAIEAVRTWKFEPAMKDGHPVRVEIAVEVDFHLY